MHPSLSNREPAVNLSALQASIAVVVAVTAAAVLATTQAQPASAEQLAAALTAPIEDDTEVRVDMVKPEAVGAGQLVFVSVQGGNEAARVERAARVRQQMAALGVRQDRLFIEEATAP